MTVRAGTVYLVGAGPGDPGLITVRGAELLERADVIVRDRLIEPALLERARPGVHIVDAGKAPGRHALPQHEINALLLDEARAGSVVVRLKGGDPFVFGRGWEEAQACRAAGVPCEVVPGVTSAVAGAASAGVPVTVRGTARGFAVIAGETGDGPPTDAELGAVACADTLVVLMGVRALPSLARRLIALGRDPDTPAAVVERATMSGARTARGTLETIADVARDRGVSSPAVIVIGPTAALGAEADGPLRGRRVVVTRPRDASHELSQRLSAMGAEVITAPLIRIRRCEPRERAWAERLAEFDWIVFTSRHGVRGFRTALESVGLDARAFAGARIAAVGPTTARELAHWGLRADLVPHEHRGEALTEALLHVDPPPRRALFPCGTLALETVPQRLRAAGVDVERLRVYETLLEPAPASLSAELERGVDAVLFASASAVRAFHAGGAELRGAAAVCIGPTTGREVRRLEVGTPVTARAHSDEGLVEATLETGASEGAAA